MDSYQKNSKELNKALKKIFKLKYVLLIVLIIVLGFVVAYDAAKNTWDFHSVWRSALQGVVMTFVITIFFDFFIRKEQELALRVDRESLLQEISKEVLLKLDTNLLSNIEINNLLARISQRQTFLDSLSSLISKNPVDTKNLVNSYLAPFKVGIHLEKVSLRSRLTSLEGDSNQYKWKMSHEFKIRDNDKTINLVVTKDPLVANAVLSSNFRCDHLVLLSEEVNYDLTDFAGKQLSFKYEKLQNGNWFDGKVERKNIPADKIQSILRLEDNTEVLFYEFEVSELVDDHRIEICYEQVMSINDPYFYNASTSHIFADEIIIDYSAIKSKIGNVSALSFVGSPSAYLSHDKEFGEVRLKINGLLQPGEGALIVWKPYQQ